MFGKSKQPKFKFAIGDEVKDTITHLKGIIIRRTQWLNNCNTYGVQPQELKDGKPVEASSFDEPQLKLVRKEVKKPQLPAKKTGGPERPVCRTTNL